MAMGVLYLICSHTLNYCYVDIILRLNKLTYSDIKRDFSSCWSFPNYTSGSTISSLY